MSDRHISDSDTLKLLEAEFYKGRAKSLTFSCFALACLSISEELELSKQTGYILEQKNNWIFVA